MAGPSSPRGQPTQCGPSILVKKSSSKPSLKTYSKRTLQDISEPPNKRQRIEHPTISVQSTASSGVPQPITRTPPKKRSISEYFKQDSHKRAQSSPQSSIFSSDPVEESAESPPSSPPIPYIALPAESPKKRIRRRLISRAPLALIKMSDINVGSSKEQDKGKSGLTGLFHPRSPSCTSDATNNLSKGVADAGNDETSSKEQGARLDGIAERRLSEGYYTPFEPGPPNTSLGYMFPPSFETAAAARELVLGSMETLVEGSVAGSQMTSSSAGTLVAGSSTRSKLNDRRQTNEEVARRESLLHHQPEDPDMMFHMSSDEGEQVLRPAITEDGNTSAPTGSHVQVLETLMEHVPSVQAQDESSPTSQALVNAVNTGIGQPIVPAANNSNQGPVNLVQTQIDLGQTTILTCAVCRFTYNRTISADVRAHEDYHDVYTMGEPVVRLPIAGRDELRRIDTGIGRGDYVVMVDSSSSQGWKNLAMTVLERQVDRDLGAININPSILWSSIPDPSATGSAHGVTKVDRFKVFMYVRHYIPKLGRVVSLLLAERITSGVETRSIQVVEDEFGPWPAIVPHLEQFRTSQTHEAVLGVNKFWTISSNRRRGYAKILLDAARNNFIPSYIVPRVHVAWTLTTGVGAKFAKNYLRRQAEYDFLTYEEL